MGCVTCDELRARIADLEDEVAHLRNPGRVTPAIRQVFEHWQIVCEHPRTKLTADVARKIGARLREQFTVADLCHACDGAARAAYVDERGVKHDHISLVCRNAEKVRLFIARADATAPRPDLTRKLVGA